MTTVIKLPPRRVPRDTFPIRLAIVRAEMGWNYDQAEAATGINSESWRVWEKGKRRCADIEGVSRTVSSMTGISWEWLMVGGALDTDAPDPNDTVGIRSKSPWIYDSSVTIGPWTSPVPSAAAA